MTRKFEENDTKSLQADSLLLSATFTLMQSKTNTAGQEKRQDDKWQELFFPHDVKVQL